MSLKKYAISAVILSVLLCIGTANVSAKPNEYEAIVRHLKTKYQAKKVNLFVMWAARAIVSMAKPAGVKSFSLTVFQHLKFSTETVDAEMQAAMRKSYGPEWSSIFHVRSQTGQQAYLYMREVDQNIRMVLVTIDKENAVVIRATLDPDKLVDFINDPRIFGISLNDSPPANPKPSDTQNPN
jgi:hypothetical protein